MRKLKLERSKAGADTGGTAVADEPPTPFDDVVPDAASNTAGNPVEESPRGIVANFSDHLPTPPRFVLPPKDFFAYWKALKSAHLDRVTVYIYRTWPEINFERIGRKYKNIDKILGNSPMELSDILPRYGSGNYNFKMNATAKAGSGPAKPVCECYVQSNLSTNNDIECDFERFPPVLGGPDFPYDLRILTEAPNNASYRQFLVNRGKLTANGVPIVDPDELQQKEREEEMAASQVIAQAQTGAVEQTKIMADLMRTVMDRKEPARQEQSVLTPVMLDLIKQRAGEPLEMLEKLTAMLPKPLPPDNSSIELLKVMTEQSTAMQAEMRRLQETSHAREMAMMQSQMEMVKDAMKREHPPAPPAKTLLEQLQEAKAINDLMSPPDNRRRSRGDEDEEKPGFDWTKLVGTIVDKTPLILSALSASVHNLAVARSGQGQPITPGMPSMPGMNGGQVGAPMNGPIQQPATQTAPVPNPANVAGPPPEQAPGLPIEILGFIKMIEPSLMAALDKVHEAAPYEYAETFIRFQGKESYRQLANIGAAYGVANEEAILGILNQYPPIAGRITGQQERVKGFLAKFCGYDEWCRTTGFESYTDYLVADAAGELEEEGEEVEA